MRPFRTDGRQEWVVEYTRKHGKPVELDPPHRGRVGGRREGRPDVAARLDLRDPANLAVARPFLNSPGTWLSGGRRPGARSWTASPPTGSSSAGSRPPRTTHDGGSINAKLGIKFSVGGKKIKLVRHLIEATATVGGGLTGKRLDCLPGAAPP